MTAVTLHATDSWCKLGAVVGACVVDVEAKVAQLEENAQHESHCVTIGPGARMIWPVVDIHLRCVHLERQLPHLLYDARVHYIV